MTELASKPLVSVILPIRNEVDFIEPCLRSLTDSDYPADRLEFVVVGGMSDDGTREVVRQLAEEDQRGKLVDNPASPDHSSRRSAEIAGYCLHRGWH